MELESGLKTTSLSSTP